MELFEYATLDNQSLEQMFKTSLAQGLTDRQVEDLRKEHGYNEIPDAPIAWWYFLLNQLKSPFLIVLMVAAVLSLFLEGQSTSIMIILIVLLNTFVGFYQEYRADRSVRLLKNMIPQLVVVRRHGKDMQIPARDLVPGDVVHIETGAILAADMRIVSADNLTIDESMLTGESLAVVKQSEPMTTVPDDMTQALNIGYSGTLVVGGRGLGVVIETGAHAAQGALGVLASQIQQESVFAQEISHFTKVLLQFIVVVFVLFLILHMVWGRTHADFFKIILFIVALAISITPEGLPIVILFVLSRSARYLAKEKVIVKRLSAVNDLGSVQILCVDKTGTLTQNSMAVAAWKADDETALFLYAALSCERPHIEHRGSHSLDDALWQMVSEQIRTEADRYEVVKVVPFDPATRSNEVIMKRGDQQVHIMRGACESVMERCGGRGDANACQWAAEQGELGRRVIAVAVAEPEKQDWNCIGLVSFIDPLKPTAHKVVQEAADLKVQIKLITGDAPEVAGFIAQEAGIITNKKEVMLGKDIAALSEQELADAVVRCHVFARVAPEEKYLIIRTLQKNYAVGFLGDGINDVLAIKAAHVGIVVQGCADIAREAADIVLLHKSLSSIIHGIRVGREGVVNIQKYIVESFGSNVGNFGALAVSSLFVSFLPLEPVQILLSNFMTDFTMLGFAGDTVDSEELTHPSYFDIPWLMTLVIVFGAISSLFDFWIFYLFSGGTASYLQTYWFIGSICTELVFIYSVRTKRVLWRATKPATLLIVLTSLTAFLIFFIPETAFGQKYFLFLAPRWPEIRKIFYLTALFFVALEIPKFFLYRSRHYIKTLTHKKE